MADSRFERPTMRQEMQAVPRPVKDEPGLVEVDTTWGTIQPMEVAEGVRTVGEVELIEHLNKGLPAADSRDSDSYHQATIPGAINLPFAEAAARRDELDHEHPTVFFCNGPQCGQSPRAIRALIEAGQPAETILYYRGGLHDWITLGLPVVRAPMP
ncbi:MAG: rhodanese-like domain-containing protein [Actinobacteria bacterium]|nr:rhodanese-like domain-containing protein [Actinomycetota bacterium]